MQVGLKAQSGCCSSVGWVGRKEREKKTGGKVRQKEVFANARGRDLKTLSAQTVGSRGET